MTSKNICLNRIRGTPGRDGAVAELGKKVQLGTYEVIPQQEASY